MADYDDGLRVVHHQNGRVPSPVLGYEPEVKPVESIETITHKTILVGDSGVGKTSLLVQFDQGKFQAGSFAATVGIGFTDKSPATSDSSSSGLTKVHHTITSTNEGNNGPASQFNNRAHSNNGHRRQSKISSRQSVSEYFDISCKVMLIGDSGVGKTCLLVQFKDGAFLSGSFISTVGIDFRNKVVDVEGTKIKLQIWDTAGQERFRSITRGYYRDANALLLLYDVTNKASFDNIRAWLTEINEYAQDDVVIMLLGNKADMSGDKIIRREDGERLARDHNVAFMETSAKTGMNVDLAFMAIAKDLKMKRTRKPDEPAFNVAEYVQQENTIKVGSCC